MADIGTLLVRVFTGRAQIPLEGATVVVAQKASQGKYNLLALRVTGQSGEIDSIPIPAPQVWESQAPGSAETPFAVCDVWAEHPDYELLVVENVQIFQGIETLQNMLLIPLPENMVPRDFVEEVYISPQEL